MKNDKRCQPWQLSIRYGIVTFNSRMLPWCAWSGKHT